MEPTSEILLGRRRIEGIPGYELVKDLQWSNKNQRWKIQFQLTLSLNEDGDTGIISDITRWYLLISPSYPQGEIDIYPAKEGGIAATFQHQSCNLVNAATPWREGKLCVNTGLRNFARRGYDSEPYEAASRLRWHIQRCILWLELASVGQLSAPGEPLELPHYPTKTLKTVAFTENEKTFSDWQGIVDQAGQVQLNQFKAKHEVVYVKSFHGKGNRPVIDIAWGAHLTESNISKVSGIWIMLKDVIVLEPWQAPITWQDLFKAAEYQGINLEILAKDTYCKAWKVQPSLLLLGFPISDKIGADAKQIHWLAVQLDKPPLQGFRPNSAELPRACVKYVFRKTGTLEWLGTENWDQNQISSRGKLPPSMTDQNIIVIGAGALGSALVELFARAGCTRITVLDNDITEIGNLSRHVLTLDDIKKHKSEALACRLNKISPSINAVSNSKSLREALRLNKDFLLDFDLIVEATASDKVLYELARANFSAESKFVSLSLGLHAHRIFCYISHFHDGIDSDFNKNMEIWMGKEQSAYQEVVELPRDGVGCWHPLFPARADDVWMLTAIVVKVIESFIVNEEKSTSFSVFEQNYMDGVFCGISKANA